MQVGSMVSRFMHRGTMPHRSDSLRYPATSATPSRPNTTGTHPPPHANDPCMLVYAHMHTCTHAHMHTCTRGCARVRVCAQMHEHTGTSGTATAVPGEAGSAVPGEAGSRRGSMAKLVRQPSFAPPTLEVPRTRPGTPNVNTHRAHSHGCVRSQARRARHSCQ